MGSTLAFDQLGGETKKKYRSSWIHTLLDEQDSVGGGGDATHASNNCHEIASRNLWESSGGIHLVHAEGDVPGTELLD